jgi:Amidohydrolase family
MCLARPIAIRDVTLIDPSSGGAPQPHSTIVIDGEHIAAAGPMASIRIPRGARVLSGHGRYVIPGLWDMHVHLWYPEDQLAVYLANGITGVRDMGSDYDRTVRWRYEAEQGKIVGPHVVTCGSPVGGRKSTRPNLPVLVADTPDDARYDFDLLDDRDVDFIHVRSDLPREAYFALAERARHWLMPFAGQVPIAIGVQEAIEARQDSIEGLSGEFVACSGDEASIRAGKEPASAAVATFDEAKARRLFRRCALFETRQVPMLARWDRRADFDASPRPGDRRWRWVPLAIRRQWPAAQVGLGDAAKADASGVREHTQLAYRMVRIMQECGVQIMAGSGTGDPRTIPGVTLDQELTDLVKAGLTPLAALAAATIEPARFLGWDDAMGSLKAGMEADLVVLNANPLEDIRNVAKIHAVISRGRYFSRAQLDAILNAVR